MSINLSDLTSPNNQDVLAEITSAADFLDPIGKLENLSRGSNKGGHALQTVALNQPRALPLIKNPSGNLGGYLYIPDVSGNYATGPSVTIGSNQTWQAEVDMLITQNADYTLPFGGGAWTGGFGLFIDQNGRIYVWSKGVNTPGVLGAIPFGTPFNLKYGYDGTSIYFDVDGVRKQTLSVSSASQSASITHPVQLNQQTLAPKGNYAIQKAKLTVNNAVVFDCDFNGSTSIRHGDTKFNCVGGPVSLTRAGQDPVTVVKKDILRFDGANDALNGLFANNIDGGYMFAAFSVLGTGGIGWGRVFTTNLSTSGNDYSVAGTAFSIRNSTSNDLMSLVDASINSQAGMFDDANGDILHVVKVENESQTSKVNNASLLTNNRTAAINSDEFNIGSSDTGSNNAAIDLEYLALFSPDSVPDEATASKIRNYINNRNNVFSLVDNSFYFYDAQKAPVGNISSGSSAWNGRIVGSDNGDTDKLATQATANDQCVGDGFKVTFADNTDHLDIPSTSQSGYQIVGSSFGTFVYRINGTTAVTELNLLGNLGASSQRKSGDLYGIILLPESATGKDIQEARKLLIDRGASDAATQNHLYAAWHTRNDIVEFQNIAMPQINQLSYTFSYMPNLVSFPAMSFPVGLYFANAWDLNTSMSDFGAIQAPLGNNFSSAWKGCSALTSFPAGAKLGTAASNVNFTSAWRSSGLTSFPALDLSNATSLYSTWRDCDDMLSFGLVQTSSVTNFSDTWLGCNSLTSFPLIDTSSGTSFYRTWYDMDSVTDFPLLNVSAGRYFSEGWRFCAELVNFPAGLFNSWNPASISSGVFDFAWDGCTSLTAQSVENILTSIDASGKYATSTGASGGTALGNAGIDIDYNTATGSLSAATNSAVTSLKAKGWSIIVNNVTL